jgi:uncharacterized membrane protein YdjX (TVP38/TMEM64 family)
MMRRVQGDFEPGRLDSLLLHHPVRTVILLRLPYLATGILNYVFAWSRVSVRHHFMGNLLGLLPGAFLFALLGGQARSLTENILHGTTEPVPIAVVVIVSSFVLASVLGLRYLVRQTTARQRAQITLVAQYIDGEAEKRVAVELSDVQSCL